MRVEIVSNKNYEFATEFDEFQKRQFVIADEFGLSNSEIKKHPEWSSTFMNFYINKEHNGEDLGVMYIAADFLKKHRLPSDVQAKQIGNTIDGLSTLVDAIERGIDIDKIVPMKDGMLDYDMWLFRLTEEIMKDDESKILLSGRVVLPDNFFKIDIIMAEGLPRAKDICNKLSFYNADFNETHHNYNDLTSAFPYIADRMWDMSSILMKLDDMGIRGRQLIDAVEYAGGTEQGLFDVLKEGRSKELVDYVNKKAAERIKNGESNKEYIAVTDGASFDKMNSFNSGGFGAWMEPFRNMAEAKYSYRINNINYEDYLDIAVKAREIDYLQYDIVNNVDTETAIKIAEARGFKLIRRFETGKNFFDEKEESILMYSDETGAVLRANGATNKNFCFAGSDITFVTNKPLPYENRLHCSNGPVGDYDKTHMRYYQWSYNNGLFSVYDNLPQNIKIDDSKFLTFIQGGFCHLPVPKYFDFPFVQERDLYKSLGATAKYISEMNQYHFENIINFIVMHYDEELFASNCPMYTPFKDEKFFLSQLHNAGSYWSSYNIHETFTTMRLAFLYLNVPEDMVSKCVEALRQYAISKDDEIRNLNEERGWHKESSYVEMFDEYVDIIVNGFEGEEKIFEVIDFPKPETLPVNLPWFTKEIIKDEIEFE